MQIRFLGGVGKVTGSCTWMHDEKRNWNFLIDCGMQQGEGDNDTWNRKKWPFAPSDIKFVVLTHAHIDHCGLIPRLYKEGFRGKVYCTKETSELAKILLADAIGHNAPYDAQDIDKIQWHDPMEKHLPGKHYPVGDDLFLKFFRAGHILGAVSVAVYWGPRDKQRSIVFSGDIGTDERDRECLPFLRHRMQCGRDHDYAVIESTYGGTVRCPMENDPEVRRARIRKLLDRILDNNGTLILPAFALGRTQDILFDLHWIAAESPERYGTINYYLDAPMASRMHDPILCGLKRTGHNKSKVRHVWLGKQIFRWLGLNDKEQTHVLRVQDIIAMTLKGDSANLSASSDMGNQIAQAWKPIMTSIEDKKTRENLLCQLRKQPTPSVVVTGSGLCSGGPVVAWLSQLLDLSRTTVALTGYCPTTSVGGQLLELKEISNEERQRHTGGISLSNEKNISVNNIRASIERLTGYSAHADQKGLLDWLFFEFEGKRYAAGKTIFIQHGNDPSRRELEKAIHSRARELKMSANVTIPGETTMWHDLEIKNPLS